MSIPAIQLDPLIRMAAAGDAPVRRAGSFEAELRAAGRAAQVEQARQAAQQMVASTFIMPVLAKMRQSPFLAGPFAPGDAERRFGPLMDQHVADRIAAGDSFPLVDRITEHLLAAEARRIGLTQTDKEG
jgi:Rod binding domain-containing protein